MANRRKDRPVPNGFRRYDGNYEKAWYDIYTWNGALFHHCWPNAGTFHAWGSGQVIEGDRVFAIRPEVESGSEQSELLTPKHLD